MAEGVVIVRWTAGADGEIRTPDQPLTRRLLQFHAFTDASSDLNYTSRLF